jgi:cytochrome c-type biogenesis protein CcmH/NrfG
MAVPAEDATVLTAEETVETTSPAVEAPLVTVNEEATPAETTPAAVEQPLPDTVPAMEPPAAPAYEEAPPTHVDTVTEAPYKVMAKAREAFWLRDFDTAEQQYRTLTQLEPDNPDGYGELGNMYFSQGKWDEAAAAYYEAATRLLDEGLVVQAREMLEVIRGLNGPQASDLEAQIANATATSP